MVCVFPYEMPSEGSTDTQPGTSLPFLPLSRMPARVADETPRLSDTCRPSVFSRSKSGVSGLFGGSSEPLMGLLGSNSPPNDIVGLSGSNVGWLNWMPSGLTTSG